MALAAIALHLVLRYGLKVPAGAAQVPLLVAIVIGGVPLIYDLAQKLLHGNFGSDLLGGVAVLTSLVLGQYLAGAIIVLMLAGGEALERYALRSASSVLSALAKRMPSVAHRKRGSSIEDVQSRDVEIGDILVVYPHEICPVDGVVMEGHGQMDESYLTGEPFVINKTVGARVISGAVNSDSALTIRAVQRSSDSRYAKIMAVMRESEQRRPHLRRLGDKLGAIYTPIALAVAGIAWASSGEPARFLAVLVIATPCPLLLGIPISIIGAISLCARRSIIVKAPVALEQVAACQTAIFDKTGTLTYGRPTLVEQIDAPGFSSAEVLSMVASLERYSRHPLAKALRAAAQQSAIQIAEASEVREHPGLGLQGTVDGRAVWITNRESLSQGAGVLPPPSGGLECVVMVDNQFASLLRFRDAPRPESRSFIRHLGPKHFFRKSMIISGDRESEVRYLGNEVGISEVLAGKSPEQKLQAVRNETARSKTLYVGDGINDAPAMMAATVGMAIGQNSDVTAEAADVVVMENSLEKVDEFIHIGKRMRTIALQSAAGGMALSIVGMVIAAAGFLSPVAGAISQEVIDVAAMLNALRAAFPPRLLKDMP